MNGQTVGRNWSFPQLPLPTFPSVYVVYFCPLTAWCYYSTLIAVVLADLVDSHVSSLKGHSLFLNCLYSMCYKLCSEGQTLL